MMNERIKELAEQAGFQWSKFGLVATPDSNAEKFAELIVRECANIDFRFKVGMTTDQEFDTGRVIKEHFGVDNK